MGSHPGILRNEAAVPRAVAVDSPEMLLGRVALGDERAFSQVYEALAGPVLGTATRVLRNRALAEEVAQETLLEIWRKAATFTPGRGNLQSWALTIAHRRAVDRVRSEEAASARETRAWRMDPRRGLDQVADQATLGCECVEVRAALRVLTALQRRAVELAYFDGFTCREVAERLEVPVSTAKSRIQDGLVRLRDAWGGSE
ncbi:sigma-70 family RNA polymerase sigma factor [Amycolatopsis rubida]|uniref:RNA polymerase sigma-70 factor, ECF subfamily n=1 Tax=Amycolatopsis rubida TaxID=112413 RepID=A0A1I5KHB6_9PSEU|nr:sigma-70 family RNA polymerase sigma factor [Amycolatopsis rubida]SFO84400.1 RNA polymerase sigma-70 factor, ECF subfamily [Amycolatopsis rubida]